MGCEVLVMGFLFGMGSLFRMRFLFGMVDLVFLVAPLPVDVSPYDSDHDEFHDGGGISRSKLHFRVLEYQMPGLGAFGDPKGVVPRSDPF